ncbi:MAG TPA: RnfABCDGE type electron transport complex subunit G [Paludibacteraceae bacterium]|nr:RnfABCDGE type electron transport complex subunit G [Paludibacteraceae bacterium]
MEKLTSSFKNMLISLLSISVFSALTLGSVYTLTKDPIEKSKNAKLENAIKEVLPKFDHLDAAEKISVNNGDTLNVYKAYDKNNVFVGAAVETNSKKGFAGEIKLMVGFDKNGNIINYSILEQKETPGLGSKMTDWFKTPHGKQDIRGKNPAVNNLSVTKDGGEIDAITAATISSRAFLDAVNKAYQAYANNPNAPKAQDANSGASQISKKEQE